MSSIKTKAFNILRKSISAAKSAGDDIKKLEPHKKIGLGLSVAGFTLGTANFISNRRRINNDQARIDLDRKSLAALNKIHTALSEMKTDVKTN